MARGDSACRSDFKIGHRGTDADDDRYRYSDFASSGGGEDGEAGEGTLLGKVESWKRGGEGSVADVEAKGGGSWPVSEGREGF